MISFIFIVLLIGIGSFLGGIIGMIGKEDNSFCIFLVGIFFIIISSVTIFNLSGKNHYNYNKSIINKHYEYENKIYKVIIDTVETNKYIKKNFILKGK